VTVAALCARTRGGPTPAEHGELLALSDARPMRDLSDARDRVARVAEILAGRADARGIFPLIYRIGLDAVVAARDGGRFRDPAWVERFDAAFVRRYLDGLHRHLRGEAPAAAWRTMYVRIDAGTASIVGTVADALTAHLINDLPEALHESRVRPYHVVDYQRLSSLIWRTGPAALSAIRDTYGVDLAPLLDAGALTWPVDALTGRPGATQEQLFFAVTRAGFAHGMALVNPLARPLVRAQIAGQWRALAAVAATFAPPTG
jgi:hypothetical protein